MVYEPWHNQGSSYKQRNGLKKEFWGFSTFRSQGDEKESEVATGLRETKQSKIQ